MKRLPVLALIALPLVLVFFGFYLKQEIPCYHLIIVDPDYAYLFNGLNLVHLHFPNHIDNPGTTLQVLAALVIRTVHLFHHNNIPIDIDVFQNPEFYLTAIHSTLIVLQAAVLFLLGYFIHRKIKNLILSVFLQLAPFASFSILGLINRVMPELMLIITAICLTLFVVLYLKENELTNKLIKKYLIIFSVITGFGIATKLTFVPLFFLPFMLMPGLKKKAVYSILSLLSFFLFAFPIFDNLVRFESWVKNLFIHSGRYGGGAATFIDTHAFIVHLKDIFSTDTLFPIVFFILIISCLLYHVPFLKVKIKNDPYYKALIGLTFAVILSVFFSAKHFGYTYLTPVLMLMVFGIYLAISIFSRPFKSLKKNIVIIPFFILFLYCIFHFEVKKIFISRLWWMENEKAKTNTMSIIEEKFKNKPTLILANRYCAPYKEYGLLFGDLYSGEKMKNKYAPALIGLYPKTYIYHGWYKLYIYWNEDKYTFIDLLKRYQNVILFVGDQNLYSSLQNSVHGINRQIDTKFKEVYFNEKTGETIYEVTYDSIAARTNNKFLCDAESLDSSKTNFINTEGQLFQNGITRSQEKALSGKYSSKLTKNNPVGMNATLSEVKQGEHYRISAWMYNNHNLNAGLVVAASDTSIYYAFQTKHEVKQGEWQKSEIDLIIPKKLNNLDINIFCRNNDDDIPAYFDDLIIEKNKD